MIKFNLNNKNKSSNSTITTPKAFNTEDETESNSQMQQIMGFGTFGRIEKPKADNKPPMNQLHKTSTNELGMKAARKFDVEELMRQHLENTATNMKSESSDKGESATEESDDSDEDDEDDMIGPPLPPGFHEESLTKATKSVTINDNAKVDKIGDNDDDDDDEDDNDNDYKEDDNGKVTLLSKYNFLNYNKQFFIESRYSVLPISHEIEFKHGNKSITALALDPNGARLVTGAIDYEVKYWDFQGMDSTLQSFRTIRPCQSHSIKHLEYNSNGELILVVSGSCIAKLVDRDGFVKAETIKGDQYIADKNNTKGHMAMLNAGTWHPMERNVFATASNDSTARLWDITKVSGREIRSHTALIKPRSKTGFFTQPNSICFSSIGDLIALGCNDGSVQMWDTRRSYVNTTHLIRPAHSQDEITSIRFSYSGNHLLSRAMDSTMKLWDMRMLKSSKRSYTPGKSQFDPLHVWDSLFNRYSQTDCFFSPDDRLAVTGVGCDERSSSNEYGHLKFFDCSTFELVQDVKCALRSSVIRTLWHPKLNQIVASSSDGSVRMLYDLERSSRGALLCSFRMKRKKKDVFSDATPQIITRKLTISFLISFDFNCLNYFFIQLMHYQCSNKRDENQSLFK